MAELSPLQQRYLNNKAQRAVAIHVQHTCEKCGHHLSLGDMFYRDVMTGKHAHITCRARKAAKGKVA